MLDMILPRDQSSAFLHICAEDDGSCVREADQAEKGLWVHTAAIPRGCGKGKVRL